MDKDKRAFPVRTDGQPLTDKDKEYFLSSMERARKRMIEEYGDDCHRPIPSYFGQISNLLIYTL